MPREPHRWPLLTASGDPDEPRRVLLSGAIIEPPSGAGAELDELVTRVGTPPSAVELEHASHHERKHRIAARGAGSDDAYTATKSECVAQLPPSNVF